MSLSHGDIGIIVSLLSNAVLLKIIRDYGDVYSVSLNWESIWY